MDVLRSSFRRYSLADSEDFALGNLRASPSARRLAGPDGELLVEPRVMQVLLALRDAGGRVIGREDLLESCWEGRIVGDDAINRAIAALRRALARIGAECRVETVPRVGYRLVTPQGEHPPPVEEAGPGPRLARRALLAFSLAAAGIGCFALLRGRQEEEARRERTSHEIRTAILTATPASLALAGEMLDGAAGADLDEARLFGLEALLHLQRADVLVASERTELNRLTTAAVDTALAADPRQGDALVAQAVLRRGLDDWAAYEASLRRILADDPDNIAAMAELAPFLQSVGRSTASRDLNLRSVELYPMAALLRQRRALLAWIFGQDDEAVRIITRAGEIWPDHRLIASSQLLLLAMTGRAASALTFIDDPVSRARLALPPVAVETWRMAVRALASRASADMRAAARTLVGAAAASPGLAANCTMLLSHMGFADEAYAVAERLVLGAVESGGGGTDATYSDPRWRQTQWLFTPAARTIREDPRFSEFADGLGYLAYWRGSGNWPDAAMRGSLRLA